MPNLFSVWTALDARRRFVVVLATLAMFATVLFMAQLASKPSMSLLYSGLDAAASGEVVNALEQRGVSYDVRSGGIYVERAQRDQLRMTLASDGLPANGPAGYELLDTLSGFGTTSQMFDATYWRAKEGELARTILSSPGIRAARVHIAQSPSSAFRQSAAPTASVTVTPKRGNLGPEQAKALKYLVASSVAGLSVADVSVIDSTRGVVFTDEGSEPGAASADLATQLKANIERLLEARMGPGRSIVEVSVETVTQRESIVERHFDPQSRVAISTETEEQTTNTSDQGGNAVTVASNLPDGEAAQDRQSTSSDSQTRERVNFEVSETQREILRAPGDIKRLSIAVLVDGVRGADDAGAETWSPLPEEELTSLQELVASAAGFNAERGDVITLKSMPFEQVAMLEEPSMPGLFARMDLDIMSIIQMAVLAIVGLVLGLFVIRPILTSQPAPSSGALPAPDPTRPGLTGDIQDANTPVPPLNVVSDPAGGTGLAALPATAEGQPDPVARLKSLIEERQSETVEVLRSWIEAEEEKA